ncbi:MAG: hypothetical protein PHS49_02170 [Candidatus Gracilibacteria bacterium]|nr:hypothetical protein [Candidatus Gracilibacteria bacterium]
MTKQTIREKIITTILMYVLLGAITIYYYTIGVLEKYAVYITLGLLILILKDILMYFVSFEKITVVKNSLAKLKKAYSASQVSFGDYYLFMNRNYFFPTVLIAYLVFILLYQIKIIFMGDSLYTLINSNFLGIVVVSGVLTTFREDFDKTYQRKVKSYQGLYKNIVINSVLSVLGALIIMGETLDLGVLSYIISLIAGLLIFLVGISILEEEEDGA